MMHDEQTAAGTWTGPDARLPALRDDLNLMPGPALENGAPSWTIYDPVRNAFFRIGRLEFEILSRWSLGAIPSIIEAVRRETTLSPSADDVQSVLKFLNAGALLSPANEQVRRGLRRKALKPGPHFLTWLALNYLFFRVPLFRPDEFLNRTLPFVRLMARWFVRFVLPAALALNIYLIGREWQAFTHTFLHFFNLKGLLFFGIAITFVKIAHELGHAYTAKHFGLRVPTLGVAFMVLWPILYTDNTDAWKLNSRRKRMLIVAAGMTVEISLAVMATLLWIFLPDGALRSAAFITATVTWISSLAINVMPFLRFDGYYFLSDLLDMPNLHSRAFAMGRWRLRRMLFGVRTPPPEQLAGDKRRFLILFAYVTWIYRLLLFIGIAILVYHLFFKTLGIVLFILELFWFVGRPVYRELAKWPRMIGETGMTRQSMLSALTILLLIGLMAVPWNSRIRLPAVAKPGAAVRIYPPFDARILSVHIADGRDVESGDLLFTLESPALMHETRQAETRVNVIQAQLRRQASRADLLEHSSVLEQQLAEALTSLDGCRSRQARLNVEAPVRGVVTDIPNGIHAERWVNERQLLAVLVETGRMVLEAFAEEVRLRNLNPGDIGRFYPNNPDIGAFDVLVERIDATGVRFLDQPYLASRFGGDLPVIEVDGNRLAVPAGLYRLALTARPPDDLPFQALPGVVMIRGRPQSFFHRAWRLITAVIIRESGF